jgi:uncharacterized protein YjbK
VVEAEIKYQLTRSEYLKLLRYFRKHPQKKVRQVNYYFDTNALTLRNYKVGLRIRTYNGKILLTIKLPHGGSRNLMRGFKVRKESETTIPKPLFNAILRGRKNLSEVALVRRLRRFLTKEQLGALRPLGKLQTVRTTVRIAPSLALEIDRCKLFNSRFYEAEVETNRPQQTDREIRTLFKECRISYRPSGRSKAERFYAAVNRAKAKKY